MSQAAPSSNLPAIHAGGQVAAIIPRTLDEAFRLAKAMSLSGLAPRGMDKPEQITVAIMAGAELGLAPFQSLQSFAVVNGRPTLWGDGLVAVARAQGVQVAERMEGKDDQATAWCVVTRPDTGETIERSFSVADAKKAGLWGKQGPWQSYPRRMLAMRARAYALRDGCADMLRGFQVREEVEDYQPIRDVTPQTSGMRDRLEARKGMAGFSVEHVEAELETVEHDPETGEVSDPQEAPQEPADAFPGDAAPAEAEKPASDDYGPAEWLVDARRWVADCEDVATLDALNKQWGDNGRWLALRAYSAADHADLIDTMKARKREIEAASK